MTGSHNHIRNVAHGVNAHIGFTYLPWTHPPQPQVVLCKHRMGMICAASGDHRAATQLLSKSLAHYGVAAAQGAGPGSEGSEQVGGQVAVWSSSLYMMIVMA